MGSIYSYAAGPSGSAPFAYDNGSDVLHVFDPEGRPIGAAWVVPGQNAEHVAARWGEEHGRSLVESRRDTDGYEGFAHCFDCGVFWPGMPTVAGYHDVTIVYESTRWNGIIRTSWVRCRSCQDKWQARP